MSPSGKKAIRPLTGTVSALQVYPYQTAFNANPHIDVLREGGCTR